MEQSRAIGYNIKKLAEQNNFSPVKLGIQIKCSEQQIKSLYEGRLILSYKQLEILSNLFNVPISDLLDDTDYQMNSSRGKEFIFDIIDEYMDIKESLI